MRGNYLKVAFLCAILSAMSYSASARPKGGVSGRCECTCVANSGVGGILMSQRTYDSHGYSCGAFNNATCNLNNPNTGGVATGTLSGCSNAGSSTTATIQISPFGGAQVVERSPRYQRRQPP
jgi:hypothetical protein